MPGPIRVALVEDSLEEREAFEQIIAASPGLVLTGSFATGEQALARIPALRPDVILIDIGLPGISGIDCIRRFKQALPQTQIMMLTVFEDPDRIFESLKAGATGYLLKKSAPRGLVAAIHELTSGGAPMSAAIARQVVSWFHSDRPLNSDLEKLSPREAEILELLSKGLLYKEIAAQLNIGLGSVRTYIERVYHKLQVRSRTEATRKRLRSS